MVRRAPPEALPRAADRSHTGRRGRPIVNPPKADLIPRYFGASRRTYRAHLSPAANTPGLSSIRLSSFPRLGDARNPLGRATRPASQCELDVLGASTAYGSECRIFGRNGAGIVAIVPELCRFLHSVVGDLRSFYPCLPYNCRHRLRAVCLMATVAGARAHHMRCNSVSVDLGCDRRSRADRGQLALAS